MERRNLKSYLTMSNLGTELDEMSNKIEGMTEEIARYIEDMTERAVNHIQMVKRLEDEEPLALKAEDYQMYEMCEAFLTITALSFGQEVSEEELETLQENGELDDVAYDHAVNLAKEQEH